MRLLTPALAALLLLVQADLWFGKGNLRSMWRLQDQLAEQRIGNAEARERNLRIEAEVADLVEGLEIVEERARGELGMIRPDEILVQVTAAR